MSPDGLEFSATEVGDVVVAFNDKVTLDLLETSESNVASDACSKSNAAGECLTLLSKGGGSGSIINGAGLAG